MTAVGRRHLRVAELPIIAFATGRRP
jgi:hypothetical protein